MENTSTQYSPGFRLVAIAVFAVVVFSFLFQNVAKQMFTPPELFSDYQSYHFAAQTLREGEDPYDIQNLISRAQSVQTALGDDVPPYRHSLLELIPVIPLTYLDYGDAKRIWIVVICATALLSVWLVMRYFLPWKATDPQSLMIGTLLLLFAPLVYSMQIHQINTLLLSLLLAGLIALRKNKIVLAAVFFAIAIQSKFFIGAVVLALLFLKQYKTVGLTMLFSIILFVVPFLAFEGTWNGYTTHVTGQLFGSEVVDNPLNPIQGAGTLAHFKNVSLTGFVTRLLTDQETVHPLVKLGNIEWIRWIGIAAFLASLYWLFRKTKNMIGSLEEKIIMITSLVLFAWFVFASPISWQHHLVLLIVAIPWLLKHSEWIMGHTSVALLFLFGLLGSMVIASPPGGSPHIVRHLFALAPFCGLIFLMVGSWMVFVNSEKRDGA